MTKNGGRGRSGRVELCPFLLWGELERAAAPGRSSSPVGVPADAGLSSLSRSAFAVHLDVSPPTGARLPGAVGGGRG
jgi:hypothetical protein